MLIQASTDNAVWRSSAAVSGDFADWLVSQRLMTPDIRRSFDAPVRIALLREGEAALPDDVLELLDGAASDRGWVREIAMYAGDTLLVHALCFAPAGTMGAHPWLAELGDSPLGGRLAQRNDVERVAQHYCRSDALPQAATRAGPGAWARRSLFLIGGAPLVLFEHLSAGFTGVPRRTEQDVR